MNILDIERSSASLSTEVREKTEHTIEMLPIGAGEGRRRRTSSLYTCIFPVKQESRSLAEGD